MPLLPYDPAPGALAAPEAGMLDTPTIQVNFNPEWAGHIDGAVARLLHVSLWLGDDVERAAAVDEVRKFLALLQERNPGIEMTDQAANTVYAGPTSGAAAPPAFRAIVPADIATALTTALTTPPAIGGTTPAAGAFTTVSGTVSDAGTNTVVDALTLAHLTSATPVAAFGVGQMFKGHSSNNTLREMGHIRAEWANQLDAARVSQVVVSAWNIGVKTDVATFYPSRLVLNSSPLVQLRWMTGGTTNVQLYHDGSNWLFLNSVGSMSFRNLASGGTVIWYTDNIARLKILFDGKISASNVSFDAQTQFHVHVEDTGTNTVLDELTVAHNTTGTAAAGFGAALVFNLESSTAANRRAGVLKALWNVATDAGAKGDVVLSAMYNPAGSPVEREGFRVRGGASGAEWAIAGATPGLTETVTGSRGGNAALADLLTKLAAKGIIVDGTS